jgi:hypothetical protein
VFSSLTQKKSKMYRFKTFFKQNKNEFKNLFLLQCKQASIHPMNNSFKANFHDCKPAKNLVTTFITTQQ